MTSLITTALAAAFILFGLFVMALIGAALGSHMQKRRRHAAMFAMGYRGHLSASTPVRSRNNVVAFRPVSFQDGRAL